MLSNLEHDLTSFLLSIHKTGHVGITIAIHRLLLAVSCPVQPLQRVSVGSWQDQKRTALKLEALKHWVSSVGDPSGRINMWAGYCFPGQESKCSSEANLLGIFLNTRSFVGFFKCMFSWSGIWQQYWIV